MAHEHQDHDGNMARQVAWRFNVRTMIVAMCKDIRIAMVADMMISSSDGRPPRANDIVVTVQAHATPNM